MLRHYILSYLGEDRPGLVDELAQLIRNHQGNWLESRMANLSGMFTGVVHLSLPQEHADAFESAVSGINLNGVHVQLTAIEGRDRKPGQQLELRVTGADRPGIVQSISNRLARLNLNVEELHTDVRPAAWSGETLFEAVMNISSGGKLDREQLRQALEDISDDLMVELTDPH